MGVISQQGIDGWYQQLSRSELTPPNYLFPIVWTTLYIMIATAGWALWSDNKITEDKSIKKAKISYILQALLNWSWSPLFFYYHLPGTALICVLLIVLFTSIVVYNSYKKLPLVSILLIPYVIWSSFACYLNFYIWMYN